MTLYISFSSGWGSLHIARVVLMKGCCLCLGMCQQCQFPRSEVSTPRANHRPRSSASLQSESAWQIVRQWEALTEAQRPGLAAFHQCWWALAQPCTVSGDSCSGAVSQWGRSRSPVSAAVSSVSRVWRIVRAGPGTLWHTNMQWHTGALETTGQ